MCSQGADMLSTCGYINALPPFSVRIAQQREEELHLPRAHSVPGTLLEQDISDIHTS